MIILAYALGLFAGAILTIMLLPVFAAMLASQSDRRQEQMHQEDREMRYYKLDSERGDDRANVFEEFVDGVDE